MARRLALRSVLTRLRGVPGRLRGVPGRLRGRRGRLRGVIGRLRARDPVPARPGPADGGGRPVEPPRPEGPAAGPAHGEPAAGDPATPSPPSAAAVERLRGALAEHSGQVRDTLDLEILVALLRLGSPTGAVDACRSALRAYAARVEAAVADAAVEREAERVVAGLASGDDEAPAAAPTAPAEPLVAPAAPRPVRRLAGAAVALAAGALALLTPTGPQWVEPAVTSEAADVRVEQGHGDRVTDRVAPRSAGGPAGGRLRPEARGADARPAASGRRPDAGDPPDGDGSDRREGGGLADLLTQDGDGRGPRANLDLLGSGVPLEQGTREQSPTLAEPGSVPPPSEDAGERLGGPADGTAGSGEGAGTRAPAASGHPVLGEAEDLPG